MRVLAAFVAGLAVAGLVLASPPGRESAIFAGGCFWCEETAFEGLPGVVSVTSGYIGGHKKNPTYDEVSAGGTGHAEAVEVIYDPKVITYGKLLDVFWRNVDPFQANGQFCDHGTQYRSAIYTYSDEQRDAALRSRDAYQKGLKKAGFGPITTEIVAAGPFYYAEDYHQQYLAKNPGGYCGLGGTGVACQLGLEVKAK